MRGPDRSKRLLTYTKQRSRTCTVYKAVAPKVQQAKNEMVTPASPTTMPAARKPLPLLLLSLSLPALLLVLSLVFLLSHTTFSLLICPLLPRLSSTRNATSSASRTGTSLGVSMDETLQAFHASMPTTPSRRNATSSSSSTSIIAVSVDKTLQEAFHAFAAAPPPPLPSWPPAAPAAMRSSRKKASAKRNKSLLKLLLRKTPQTRRFAARADEFFAAPCTDRFFMTWLSPLAQFGRRELLVLESLFRWHRGGCLLVASDTMDSAGGRDKLRPFLERGFRLAVASPDFAYLLNGTPAEAWLGAVQRGGVSLGSVPLGQNLSNLLRLALLYRYGGIYLDADVVVLRPLSDLRNAIGAQAVDEATGDWRRLNNAVMVFDRAHPLLHEFIAEFAAAFDGSKWGHNGPYLVSRVASRLRHRSPDLAFAVLPPRAFYPVHWSKIGGLFVAPKDRKDKRWVKAKVENIKGESFGIHLWNRESSRLEMEEGSVVGTLISDSCLFCNSSMFVKQG
ncbi:uncharacterized protein At4g19900-like [Miscanthus floridulus]|uniref:uncharacterized protein At4g19900-like n=1 Tax=Miscanthus floridulus TaxID=154761 RepID=UPI00345A6FE9